LNQVYEPFIPAGFGLTIFKERYAAPGETSWDQLAARIVNYVEADESEAIRQQTFELINTARFIPAGRTLHGAGRPGWNGNMINCYIFKPEDNKESIGKFLQDIYITATSGGGTGYNASNIRPKGAAIGSHYCAAPGVVSLAKTVDAIGGEVRAGGSRRAAILGALNIRHPDVLEWIRVKQDKGVLENHNISLYIDNEFITAVKADVPWEFKFNGNVWNTYEVEFNAEKRFLVNALSEAHCLDICRKYYAKNPADTFTLVRYRPISAKWLWKKICESNLKCAEPGILNEGLIKEMYAPEYFEPWAGSNPCTEAVTGHMGNCTLGSLNLSKYGRTGTIDYATLGRDVALAVRFLDNVLSKNRYPLAEQKAAAELTRRIGLGVLGYAHLLIDLKLRYGSPEALAKTRELFQFIRDQAFLASIELAAEKGSFDAYHYESIEQYLGNEFIKRLPEEILDKIRVIGLRNAVLLSIAPTGTIGSLTGTSTSIEPIFAPAYNRYWRNGEMWMNDVIFDSKFKEMTEAGTDASYCVGAYDVTPEQHMATIATVQYYIDQAISKTINCPKTTALDDFSEALLKYVAEIKGVSTYLEGSRGFEPLQAIPVQEAISLINNEKDANSAEFIQQCSTGACEL
jgi:ribonucleoside-diphosphate reductase alpha chain